MDFDFDDVGFVTSDHHFGHARIIELCDRPFGSVEEMDAELLVPGNHDRVSTATQTRAAIARFTPVYQAAGWTVLPETLRGGRRGIRLAASHYPYYGDSHGEDRFRRCRPVDDGTPLLHGHIHARDHGPNLRQFHVGVDAWDFAPVPMATVDAWLAGLGAAIA
ncbi:MULTISPECIES: hypothetical protein [Microbacterium]|uniref:hypothetical protein n=1 Tax=Microbacterium TaxID=33882 RepID=UPI00217E3DF2|nr:MULTISPECIES: hypothetical protein [Microbacterium]UWF77794.1 hypothetical protein JSY13_01615 [Microbacterium neungamense]WCM55970.1 hypothetical protein JRG78_01650 [Microbacterium sp. EF45047]